MPQASGAKARLSYCEETTWGTTPATPSMIQLKAATPGVALKSEVEKLVSNAINGNRAVEAARGGNITVSGSVPFELPLLGIGKLFKHALGPVTTTGTAAPYTHVIKRGSLPAGLSMEVGYTDISQYFVYRGCRVNQLSLSVGNSGIITGSLDLVGKEGAAPATTSLGTPTAATHTPFVQHEAAFLEAGVAAKVISFSLTLANNMESVRTIGSRNLASLPEGKGDLTGSMTVIFEDVALINKVLNETQTTLKLTFSNASGSIEFLLPAVKLFGAAGNGIETAQGLVTAVDFQGLYDATEATDLKITITNSETAL